MCISSEFKLNQQIDVICTHMKKILNKYKTIKLDLIYIKYNAKYVFHELHYCYYYVGLVYPSYKYEVYH